MNIMNGSLQGKLYDETIMTNAQASEASEIRTYVIQFMNGNYKPHERERTIEERIN